MSQSLEQGKRKLTAKDAITAGALGAVCIAIRFVFMLVGGVSPYVWFATHLIDAILIGPVFMLMVAKVRKNGPFLLTSLVTGVVLVAATWMFPITGLVGGLLCELCLRAGQFREKGWLESSHSRIQWTEMFLEFAAAKDAGREIWYQEALVFDLYRIEKSKSRPLWAASLRERASTSSAFFCWGG